MTSAFQQQLIGTPAFNAIIDVMCLGASAEEKTIIESYRKFLALVDSFINYYQSESDSSHFQTPIFYALESNDDMRRVLARYLTVRLGVLKPGAAD